MKKLCLCRYGDPLPGLAAVLGPHQERIYNYIVITAFAKNRTADIAMFLVGKADAEEFRRSRAKFAGAIDAYILPSLSRILRNEHFPPGDEIAVVVAAKI